MGATAWSPDGKTIAFVSNISGRNNIWLVPAEGGWPTQLTVSDQRQSSPTWSPDGKWIAYQSDYDGDEQWDIFFVSPKTGQVVNITNTREIAEENPTWSPDGRYLAYTVKPKTSSVYEIDVFDTLMRDTKHLTTGHARGQDERQSHLVQRRQVDCLHPAQAKGTDSNIFIAEVATGKSTLLTPHEGEQLYTANEFSPDGKQLLITSNAGNGYDNVGLLDIATQENQLAHAGQMGDRRRQFFSGRQVRHLDRQRRRQHRHLPAQSRFRKDHFPAPAQGREPPGGAESAFTRDGSRLLYYHNGPTSPNDVWVYSLADGKSHPDHAFSGGWRAFGGHGRAVSGALSQPRRQMDDLRFRLRALQHGAQRQNAAVVYVHGGPTSQTVNSFSRIIQHLVNQGYMVIAPNYRGSTGYGKEFQQANLFDMGGGDLQDVLAAADWIKQTGYLDPKKLILMGGSYGGYMTMMGVTKAPDVWAAGVPIVPFVNWFTEIANEDPVLQQSDLATMGDPEKNKELFHDRSPIFFVDQIKAPLLLLAGGNDPRCPKEEAQQVVDAVKKRGGVVDYKVYENEGHGFARVENQIDAYKRVSEFLKARVPPADCGCSLNQ